MKHTQLNKPPINPRTNKPYHPFTLHWWRWWNGLSNFDKGFVARTYKELKTRHWKITDEHTAYGRYMRAIQRFKEKSLKNY
jgi:hypothetical protein